MTYFQSPLKKKCDNASRLTTYYLQAGDLRHHPSTAVNIIFFTVKLCTLLNRWCFEHHNLYSIFIHLYFISVSHVLQCPLNINIQRLKTIFLNSSLNFFIYCFVSKTFRKSLMLMLSVSSCAVKRATAQVTISYRTSRFKWLLVAIISNHW